jgi:hypothetical protein
VKTIKALVSRAIFAIVRIKARAIKGIALRVIDIRLFSPKTY